AIIWPLPKARGHSRISLSKLWIEVDRPPEQRQSLVVGVDIVLGVECQTAQIMVVGVPAARRFVLGTIHFRFDQSRDNGSYDAECDPVLQVKRVLSVAVKLVGPQMDSRGRLDQLTCDP